MANNSDIKKIQSSMTNYLTSFSSMLRQPVANPDEILRRIGGRIEIYKSLLYDAHVKSCVQSRRSGVLKLEYILNKGDANDVEFEFLTSIFKRFKLKKIISEMLEAPLFGYKIMEVIWLSENGYLVPTDIIGRPQEWFTFDGSGIPLFRDSSGTTHNLYPNKFFVIQHNADYKNPFGEAILSSCYYNVMNKKEIANLWATFTDKYGMPFLFAYPDNQGIILGDTKDKTDEILDALDSMRQDGVGVMPAGYKVEAVTIGTVGNTEIYQKLIEYYNNEISKAILSSTLTQEIGDKGAYAASKTHQEVRQDVIDGDKQLVEEWFNKLIRWVVDLNFGKKDNYPEFAFYEEQDVDAPLADVVFKLKDQVKFNKSFYVNNMYWKEDEFEVKDEIVPDNPTFADAKPAVDNFSEFDEETTQIIESIAEQINKAESFDEIEEYLNNALPGIDTKKTEEILSKAFLIANTGGRLQWNSK